MASRSSRSPQDLRRVALIVSRSRLVRAGVSSVMSVHPFVMVGQTPGRSTVAGVTYRRRRVRRKSGTRMQCVSDPWAAFGPHLGRNTREPTRTGARHREVSRWSESQAL